MKEDNIIVQKWFHFYDELDDGRLNRKVKEVMDIYTNNDYICHDISNVNLTNLHIVNYTNKNELPFIHNDKQISIRLGAEKWAKVPSGKCENKNKDLEEDFTGYKHAKISISYHTEPDFEKKEKFSHGYKTNFISQFLSHPEFHVNLQKGMKLNKDSINFSIFFKNQDNGEYRFDFNIKNKLLHVQKEIGKNKYILNLDSGIFNKLNEKSDFTELILNYEVENQSKFLLMPFFMLFTWFLSFMEVISFKLLGFPYIMLITALIIYLNLIREDYEIPYNRLVIILFFFSFLCLLIKTIMLFT